MVLLKRTFFVALAASLIMVLGCDGNSETNSSNSSGSGTSYNVTGKWRVTITYTDGYSETWILDLTQTGSSVTGDSYEQGYESDATKASGTVSGTSISLTENWGDGDIFSYSGTITSASTMSGNAGFADGSLSGSWVATKL